MLDFFQTGPSFLNMHRLEPFEKRQGAGKTGRTLSASPAVLTISLTVTKSYSFSLAPSRFSRPTEFGRLDETQKASLLHEALSGKQQDFTQILHSLYINGIIPLPGIRCQVPSLHERKEAPGRPAAPSRSKPVPADFSPSHGRPKPLVLHLAPLSSGDKPVPPR